MGYLVGLAANGVLLAGTGETLAQALGELVEEVGDDAQIRFSEQLTVFREGYPPPRPAAPYNASDGVSGGEDRGQTGLTDSHGSGSETYRSEKGTDDGPHPATVETDEQTRCAVCGAEVTSDRAEVALDDYGEVRCKECSG